MFITKKYLSRRTLLRGFGSGVALPLLDAMIPAATALEKTAANPTPHMGFIYFPHGAVMNKWTPEKVGRDFELPQIIAPLEPFKEQLTIVSGLGNKPAMGTPVHAITPGTWLSCVSPRVSHDPLGGITVDQVAAQHIGQDTALPTMEVATEEQGGEGACDRSYGCSYGKTISFRNPSTPLPMEHNPRKLFQQLFGQGDTPEERKAMARENASILDLVRGEAAQLGKTLGARDNALLGDYLETVREIERRVQKMESRDLSHMLVPAAPAGIPDSFDEHISLMFDMIALAYQANLTRVFSYMMAAEVSNKPYNHIGVADAFHPLSHHQNNPAKLERLARVQTYHSEVFARFLTKLAEMPDGDGSMLDHSMILFGSNMSDSNLHNNYPLPTALVGGGCGNIRGNQHLSFSEETPIANLHLTLLQRAGSNVDSHGDSTGLLAEL